LQLSGILLDVKVRSFYSVVVEVDHLTVPVSDYDASKRFYARALQPLGYEILMDWPDARRVYLGSPLRPSSFWITVSDAAGALEVALVAEGPDSVDAFHAAALAAGGRSAGEPRVRPEHSRDYYAARVLDPDGNAIEAVYRGEAATASLSAAA
jgi:catechol 2,3-dioxygenase-like lactoylglutathione lyase family enzyme